MSYERPNIRAMSGYTAGEQPRDPEVIKLNTNENPYPAPDSVTEALRGIRVEELRRYPPPLAEPFRAEAARCHGLSNDNIIPTNGGDELLRLAVTTFVEPGQAMGVAEPSYSLYPVLADIHGCDLVRLPLDSEWNMPRDFAGQLNQAGVKLAFVVNPHAPTGMLLGADELARIARDFHGVLLIDEAYVDFVDPAREYDALPLVRQFDNVLILRTLSKGYSLAGLRFAYGIGHPSLLAPMLYKTRDSYNTDYVSQKLATAALRGREQAASGWGRVREERARLERELGGMGFTALPSESNFLLVRPPADSDAAARELALDLYKGLKKDGILVRYFDQDRLRDRLRISIGAAEENSRLLQYLQRRLQR